MAEYVVSTTTKFLGHQFSYLFNYKSNFKQLKDEVEKLKEARAHVQAITRVAEANEEEVKMDAEKWLFSVDKIIEEAVKIIEEEEKGLSRCFAGLCPDLKTRFQLRRKAATEVKAVVLLLYEGEKFHDISSRTIPEEVSKLITSIGDLFSYLLNYKSYFKILNAEVDKLINARARMLRKIQVARRNGEEIYEDVEKWLCSVDKLIEEARVSIDGFELKAEKRCLIGLCPDLVTRYQLSDKAVRELKAVIRLRGEGVFDRVSYSIIPRNIWLTSTKDYETFESRMSTLKDIYSTLCDSNVKMIGVYGMGGIGKTTLMKQFAAQAEQDNLFDVVVFVEVTPNPDIKRIQGEIADQLGLMFHEENEYGRARRLYDRVRKENSILVILDNIWTSIDLETVGISFGDDQRGCKVLLTSRNHDVLSNKMGSQKNFLVGLLTEEEAFNLFIKMAGVSVENRELQSLAIDVAKACGGLPIAIASTAMALRDKSVSAWENALQNLRRPSSSNFTGMLAEVYLSIELSYNHLEGEELKSTFLLCSLVKYSDEAPIMDLLKYGMGLGLFKGISTLEETRYKVDLLVHELKSSCLLLDGHASEWFSIHDVVRLFAISIASRDQHIFTLRNEVVLIDWLDKDMLKSCSSISIHDSNIRELPEGLEYPQLKFFYMNVKDPFFKIPDNFFLGMTKLNVLNLTKMYLLSLPSSLHLLVNLRTLCLHQCILGDIAGIGNLKKLEILSLPHSDFKLLPKEIGELTRLKLLDLSNCSKLKVISPNVISSLTQLEELYLGNSFVEWEFEVFNIERSNASLHELKHLSQLTTLEIHIPDAKILPVGLFSKKLKRYKIFIGDEWDWYGQDEFKRTLKLKLNTSIGLENDIIMQLKGIEDLYLDEVQGVKNVLYDLDGEGFPQLKHLYVQNNPDILYIVDLVEWLSRDTFPLLESLFLCNLINLEKICHGQLTAESFSKLRIMKVRNCDKLRNILSISVVRGLPQLQTIEVIKCKNMEEIFTIGREDGVQYDEEIECGQLRSLTLKFLPQLTSFYCKVKTHSTVQKRHKELTTDTWSNKVILEDELDTPMPFLNGKILFPNLEALELCAINCQKIWHNQLIALSSYIENLTRLIVRGCDKLKYLFSFSLARRFVQLQHLEICYCMVLEDIVAKEDGAEATATFVFPQVTYLKLWNLPKLRTFYPGVHTLEWPLLKRLELSGCDKANIFTSEVFSSQEIIEEAQLNIVLQKSRYLVETVATNLKELKLSGKYMTMICQGQFRYHIFDKLEILEVVNDKSASFPLVFFQRFRYLQKLELISNSYGEIFSCEEDRRYAGTLTHLQNLKLWKLSDLKYMWKQDSKLDSILQNLEILEVWWCDNLINLVPSSTSFQNLTTLELWYCRGLKNLLASSTAKSLVQLLKMSIDGCEMMTEIIASEGDVAEDEIIFSKLKCLSLDNLESLTSFCSSNYTFKFPSLEDLYVIECPKMKIFSPGVLSAPRLREVRQNWGLDEGYWDGDLNTTIQKLHKEKNCQSSKED